MLPADDSVMDDMVGHPKHSRQSLDSGVLLTACHEDWNGPVPIHSPLNVWKTKQATLNPLRS